VYTLSIASAFRTPIVEVDTNPTDYRRLDQVQFARCDAEGQRASWM
jgi:hypothetical protein